MNKKIIQKMCIALRLITFACFLTSLVFSSKVSAVNYRYPATGVDISIGENTYTSSFNQGKSDFYTIPSGQDLWSLKFNFGNGNIFKGQKFALDYSLYYTVSSSVTPPITGCPTPRTYVWAFEDCRITVSDGTRTKDYYMLSGNISSGSGNDLNISLEPFFRPGASDSSAYVISYHVTGTFVGDAQVSNLPIQQRLYASFPSNSVTYVSTAMLYLYDLPTEIAEAEEKTEEATQEGESNANASESQNEGATQNVISVMGQVVSAFQTPAGNCSLDMDLGSVDFGAINLCSGKPPAIASLINLIGSIVVVYAIYLCSRAIFRIWLAMSVFAQGGSRNG